MTHFLLVDSALSQMPHAISSADGESTVRLAWLMKNGREHIHRLTPDMQIACAIAVGLPLLAIIIFAVYVEVQRRKTKKRSSEKNPALRPRRRKKHRRATR